jgi:hypothetical protein
MAIDLSEAIKRPWERVAQPVEHVTFNHGVLGSSPSALTKRNQRLKRNRQSSEKALCGHCVGKSIAALAVRDLGAIVVRHDLQAGCSSGMALSSARSRQSRSNRLSSSMMC